MFKHIHVINAVMEEHKVLHILNMLSVALVIRHGKCMHHIICHLWREWAYSIFPVSHKCHDLWEKNIKQKNVCFDFLYDFCLKHS
jgi:hypothetical protein